VGQAGYDQHFPSTAAARVGTATFGTRKRWDIRLRSIVGPACPGNIRTAAPCLLLDDGPCDLPGTVRSPSGFLAQGFGSIAIGLRHLGVLCQGLGNRPEQSDDASN